MNLARLLMLTGFGIIGALVRRPLLVAAAANIKKVPREDRTSAALRRFARKTDVRHLNGSTEGDAEEEITSDVYISGLANVFSSWLLSALVVAPQLMLFILLGDAYILPCLGLIGCLLLSPVHYLGLLDTRMSLATRKDPASE